MAILATIFILQIDAVKKAHIRGLLNAFKVPSQSTLKTQQEANEQAKEAAHMPGQIEDLTDLLEEDWKSLGSVREMGLDMAKFFRKELEKTWGSKHLAILDETEAGNWVMGVGVFIYEFNLEVTL